MNLRPLWFWPVAILGTLAVIPVALVVLLTELLSKVLLLLVVWLTWCPRRRYALVVYSESPVWREYFESQVLPALAGRAIVLNWSERKRWKRSLAVALFWTFAGHRDFNPLAIIFEPLRWPRRFRFRRAFLKFKRGYPNEVEKLRREFFARLNELAPTEVA